MKQIVLNYLVIFIIPFLLGALIRFLFRKRAKAWIVSAITAFLALFAFAIAQTVPNHGSERYAILMIQAICLLLGSLLIGVVTRIINRKSMQ